MELTLDNNYRVVSDSNNYELKFRNQKEVTKNNKETGLEETKTITESWSAYYPTLQGALRKYVDECPKELLNTDVFTLIKKLDDLHTTIKNIGS